MDDNDDFKPDHKTLPMYPEKCQSLLLAYALQREKLSIVTFAMLPNNAERLKFTYHAMKKAGAFPMKEWMQIPKNVAKSAAARAEGNRKFVGKTDYIGALKHYNEALCFAPPDSESLAIAYANRSAVYFNCGLYEICIENIEKALKNPYPEKLKSKLIIRKEKCIQLMAKEDPKKEIESSEFDIKLSHPANPKIPFASESLMYNRDTKYGRHVLAKSSMKIGDVILMEDSFIRTIHKSAAFTHCYHCANHCYLNLEPCPLSTIVMFCSKECADLAWNSYYRFECPIVNGLYDILLDSLLPMVRMALIAFTTMDNPDELLDLVESMEDRVVNALNMNYNGDIKITKLLTLLSLTSDQSKYSMQSFECQVQICAILYHMLKKYSNIHDLFETPEHEDLFMELLVRFYQITRRNYFEMEDAFNFVRKDGKATGVIEPMTYATGINLISSLFNHSCYPNVEHISAGSKNYFVVTRSIKLGEQLFVSYGITHTAYSLENRLRTIQAKYHFDCDCIACEKKYPIKMAKKKIIKRKLLKEIGKLHDYTFDDQTLKLAHAMKPKICEFLTQNEIHYPCWELELMRDTLVKCFRFFAFKEPLARILTSKENTFEV